MRHQTSGDSSAAQWAALIARDRGCIRCGRSPRHCHAHHIIHWKDGGRTDLQNLALLCSRCHNDLHHGHYTITMNTHTIPVITHWGVLRIPDRVPT
jgi:5-methylcytosine-specific restriction endonuclease McrA